MRWAWVMVVMSAPAFAHDLGVELGSSYLPLQGGAAADAALEFRISLPRAGSIDLRSHVSLMLERFARPSTLSSTPAAVQTVTVCYRTPKAGDAIGFSLAMGPGLLVQYAVKRGGDTSGNDLGFAFELSPTVDVRLGDVVHFLLAVNVIAGFARAQPVLSAGLAAGFVFDLTPPRAEPQR